MTQYLSPLVDVNEIDLSTTIPAVATSIGVLVIRDSWKGPELKRQLVNDVDELIEEFGEPETGSFKDILAGAGFLKYGINLYCTRALAPSATFAGLYGTAASAGTLTPYVSGSAYQLSDFESEDSDEFNNESTVFDAGRPDNGSEMAIIAKDRGEYGNYLQIAYCGRTTYDAIKKGTQTAAQVGMSQDLYDDIKQQVDTDFDSNKQILFLVRRAQQSDINKSPVPYGFVEAAFVSTDPREVNDQGVNIYAPNYINQFSDYIRIAVSSTFENKSMATVFTTDWINQGGGVRNQGDTVLDADIVEAYELYQDPEIIDVNLFIDADKSDTVKQCLISIAEGRKDSMAVLDVPYATVVNNRGDEATDVRDYRNGLYSGRTFNENSSYSAIYGNWLEVYDKWNAIYRWVPSSGHAAGIFANTDDVAEAWFAPAGLNRGIIQSVRRLAFNPVKAERDVMYKNGVNPIVSFTGTGKVVYGQKTLLQKNSAFNRINVRRLFMIIGKATSTALQYFLFEPNDIFTRVQIINLIDPFLRDVKARRGVYDYLIVCDERNNTPARIDRNELWIDVYIKPVRAAEFIVLNLIATQTGVSFTELIAASTP